MLLVYGLPKTKDYVLEYRIKLVCEHPFCFKLIEINLQLIFISVQITYSSSRKNSSKQ